MEKLSKRRMYWTLFKDYLWFYKESFSFMSHQSKIKTFFQAIPKSFTFVAEQKKYYTNFL